MAKKVKAFNVDEDIYNGLLDMFKKRAVNASLSSFVNSCLGELFKYLKTMEQVTQDQHTYNVPMPFVIAEMIKSLTNMKLAGPILTVGQNIDAQEIMEGQLLERWEDEYEARQLGVSVEMYPYVKDGKYIVSSNKQYLIEKETGKKFFVMRGAEPGTLLLEIKEE